MRHRKIKEAEHWYSERHAAELCGCDTALIKRAVANGDFGQTMIGRTGLTHVSERSLQIRLRRVLLEWTDDDSKPDGELM